MAKTDRRVPGVYIGTAGWSIPRASAPRFDDPGSHLQRYARLMPAAEINSSFSRSHTRATYERWASSTPHAFRFSVKIPRLVTHERKLRDADEPFDRFLDESAGLGHRRGPLLLQLPPSLAFERPVAKRFLAMVRRRHAGPVVCEPRHPSWSDAAAGQLLCDYEVSSVAADPPPAPGSDAPGGWPGLVYFRWHGSPRKYWSSYDSVRLEQLAGRVLEAASNAAVWCIFDNTASGAALDNAWELHSTMQTRRAVSGIGRRRDTHSKARGVR